MVCFCFLHMLSRLTPLLPKTSCDPCNIRIPAIQYYCATEVRRNSQKMKLSHAFDLCELHLECARTLWIAMRYRITAFLFRIECTMCSPKCIVGVPIHCSFLSIYNEDSRTGHMQNSTFAAKIFHARINAHCCRRILNFSYPLSALYSFKCKLQTANYTIFSWFVVCQKF